MHSSSQTHGARDGNETSADVQTVVIKALEQYGRPDLVPSVIDAWTAGDTKSKNGEELLVFPFPDYDMLDDVLPWFKIRVRDAVLALWPNMSVCKENLYGEDSIHIIFDTLFGIQVTPVGCVQTLPDTDSRGNYVANTGGRYDFFFFVKAHDVPKCNVERIPGMQWWSDVYLHRGEGIYPLDFRQAYPQEA